MRQHRPGMTTLEPSRRVDAVEEAVDLGLQMQALARQRLGGSEHPAGRLARFVRPLGGVTDVDGDIGRARYRRANADHDVVGRAFLLLDRSRDRAGDTAAALDGLADRLDATTDSSVAS
jgi:hypothetical protein